MKESEYLFYKWDFLETKHFIVGQDWSVPIKGFFIIEPKRKEMKSILDMTPEEYDDYSKVFIKVRKMMKDELGIDIIYFYQEETGKHFHVWLFPRYTWMDKFGESIESVRKIIDYAEKNMTAKKHIMEVKEYVEKAQKYFKR